MKIERKKKISFLPRVKREEPVFGNKGVYKFFLKKHVLSISKKNKNTF